MGHGSPISLHNIVDKCLFVDENESLDLTSLPPKSSENQPKAAVFPTSGIAAEGNGSYRLGTAWLR